MADSKDVDPERTRKLIEAYRAGDRGAREQVFRELLDFVRRELPHRSVWRRFLRKREELDEIASEMTIRLLAASKAERHAGRDAIQRFESKERGSFQAFLATVMTDVVNDRSRREGARKRGGGRRPESLDDSDSRRGNGRSIAARDPTPSSAVSRAELEVTCDEALEDDQERSVWRLSKIEERTNSEIAQELRIPPRRVRALIEKASKRVRRHLS